MVWIRLPPKKQDKIWPSFNTAPQNQTVVVVVQEGLVSDLPDNRQSQLNLIYFCKLALNPLPLALPDLLYQTINPKNYETEIHIGSR